MGSSFQNAFAIVSSLLLSTSFRQSLKSRKRSETFAVRRLKKLNLHSFCQILKNSVTAHFRLQTAKGCGATEEHLSLQPRLKTDLTESENFSGWFIGPLDLW